jgi:hypothetical protein
MTKKNVTWILCIVIGLTCLYGLGLGMRRAVLAAQYRQVGPVLPFTLESALYKRRVQQVVDTGRLPRVDIDVQYPDGVVVAETYTVGSEYVYSRLSRWFPASMALAERLRWLEGGWFCLGIPLLAIWVGFTFRSPWAGLVAGAFYAVSLGAVIRSTGQELIRENFALPLLLGHLALDAVARHRGPPRGAVVAAAASSLCLAWAMTAWDLVQFYVGLWVAFGVVQLFRGTLTFRARTGRIWLGHYAALVAAGILNPYLRAHGFVGSPLILLGLGVVLGMAWQWRPVPAERSQRLFRHAVTAALLCLPPRVGAGLEGGYGRSYGHFGALLWAKIIHLNRKPLDPALLDFDQRIMWVPGLNSANIELTFTLFPAIVPLAILGGVFLLGHARCRSDSNFTQLVLNTAFTFTVFCLFVRFHVFLAVFLAALMGAIAAWAITSGGARLWTTVSLLALGFVVETGRVVSEPERWGRPGVYYRELTELTDWMKENVAPEPVLANFKTSSTILSEAGCPILLHPKFETLEIRDRVRRYGEELFTGTPESFRTWADTEGAGYYVYSTGQFAQRSIQAQMRYMVNAVNPPLDAPARKFERGEEVDGFRHLWSNRKYRVFRIRTAADKHESRARSLAAERAFQRGELVQAETEAEAALTLDEKNVRAADVLRHVTNLRKKGFEYGIPNDGETR